MHMLRPRSPSPSKKKKGKTTNKDAMWHRLSTPDVQSPRPKRLLASKVALLAIEAQIQEQAKGHRTPYLRQMQALRGHSP